MATFNVKRMMLSSRFFEWKHVECLDANGNLRWESDSISQARTYVTNLNQAMISMRIYGKDLAKIVGVDRRTIVMWRHGVRRPLRNNLMVLNRVFFDVTSGKGIWFKRNPNKR